MADAAQSLTLDPSEAVRMFLSYREPNNLARYLFGYPGG